MFLMANIETQFLISKDIKNHELFLKKIELKQQASSYKQQAGGWDPKGTSTRGGWAHSSQAVDGWVGP